jgi:hypothetical protein
MRARRSRVWAAWIASAFVHALVAALVLRAGERAAPRTPEPQAGETVEVEFEARAEVRPDPSPWPSPRQAGRGDRKGSLPIPPHAAERGELERASPAPPREGNGGSRSIDLSLDVLPDEIKGRFAGPPPPEGTLRAPPGRFDVGQLRAELERRQDAVGNVEAGRVDPLLYDYLRGARARFQSTAERLADDLALGAGDTVRAWGRGYLRSVADANRGALGARVDAPREGGGDTRNEKFPGADVLGAYGEAHRQAEAGAEERSAEVCLDVAAGRDTTVVLRRGSGNAALDRLTLESFTKAVAARPVPPDARRGLACYELRISAFRVPPLPVLACSFDIGFRAPSCVWPFKKVTSVKGRLLSVEYPPAAGDSARRGPSLLRKPR